MAIYVHKDGKQLGPYSEADLKSLLANGTVTLHDAVWWEGQPAWVALGQTPYSAGGPVLSAAPGVTYPIGTVFAPNSKYATWALVAGCLSLICGIFASIPAIIFGHMSLAEIKKNPGMQGHGMALAGVILGYVFTAFFVIYIGIVVISVLIALGNQVPRHSQSLNVPAITHDAFAKG
jgi:hypothetical protein